MIHGNLQLNHVRSEEMNCSSLTKSYAVITQFDRLLYITLWCSEAYCVKIEYCICYVRLKTLLIDKVTRC